MVPLNMTYLHCLQHSLFEHLFNLYYCSATVKYTKHCCCSYCTSLRNTADYSQIAVKTYTCDLSLRFDGKSKTKGDFNSLNTNVAQLKQYGGVVFKKQSNVKKIVQHATSPHTFAHVCTAVMYLLSINKQ